jgi:hypothetical protein
MTDTTPALNQPPRSQHIAALEIALHRLRTVQQDMAATIQQCQATIENINTLIPELGESK